MTFKLTDDFVREYESRTPPFGFVDAAGTSLGEVTFLRTYSRLKEDGTKETWTDACRRVIEGMYEIQRQHVVRHQLPWSGSKAQYSARDAFDRMWNMKWLPPGRGIWAMGTEMTLRGNAAPLLNCAFVSTDDMPRDNPGRVFSWIMEASMLGVGVGFDGKGSLKGFDVHEPGESVEFVVPDTREGWGESLKALINSYLLKNQKSVQFDYSQVRPAGSPIKTFGGTASGPDPLRKLHEKVRSILTGRVGQQLTLTDIADIGNLIGVCVVAGNVRRSAELFMGPMTDEFLGLKDFTSESGQARAGHAWLSNNSVEVTVQDDLDPIVPGIIQNGEPGVIWLDMARRYGRLCDPPNNKDWRVKGFNPCAEQSLESWECCTLTETFPTNHESLEDYLRTLKYAYLYAKTITLMSTPWPETNAVMLRNRRIGTSMSGVADFYDTRSEHELVEWQRRAYDRIQELDRSYSEWLGIRESIKTTTVKPSGTVSLLAGVSPGVHWQPGSKHYFRLMRVRHDDPLAISARNSGYRVEPAVSDPDGTSVIYFPMVRDTERGEHDVSLLEKYNLAALSQRFWSDNAVSVTLSYSEAEKTLLGPLLKLARGNLKTVSFLPLTEGTYEQMPYTQATEEQVTECADTHLPMVLDYSNGLEALGESGCSTDVCELKTEVSEGKG